VASCSSASPKCLSRRTHVRPRVAPLANQEEERRRTSGFACERAFFVPKMKPADSPINRAPLNESVRRRGESRRRHRSASPSLARCRLSSTARCFDNSKCCSSHLDCRWRASALRDSSPMHIGQPVLVFFFFFLSERDSNHDECTYET